METTTLPTEPQLPADTAELEALVTAVFGPGRFAKTAERLREQAQLAAGFVARDGGRIVGSVRLWHIRVGGMPALFLGPIAVSGDHRRGGLGTALVQVCIDHAKAEQACGILLVGDAWFHRFGFVPAPDLLLSGPVDRRRLFWLALKAEVEPAGRVVPVGANSFEPA